MLHTCTVNLAVRAVKLVVLPRANCAGSAVRRLQADIIVCDSEGCKPAVQTVFLEVLIHSNVHSNERPQELPMPGSRLDEVTRASS